jgi:hypothetical protein
MTLTVKDREFLEAVVQDKLPRYDSLGALRRAAARLISKGLLDQRQQGDWTRYILTSAGRAEVSTTPLADALAGVDYAQNTPDQWGLGRARELAALRDLAEAVRAHLLAHPERG